jgi:tetratricopeptide (TPR) repeat protein
VEVDGKDRDFADNVRTTLGDPVPVNFDLQAMKQKQDAMAKAMETGQLTAEQSRGLSAEAKAQMDKQVKEREAAMKKNKALSDAFNEGMTALTAKNYEQAAGAFQKASEVDPKQHVVWAHLAESYVGEAGQKTGAEKDALLQKGYDAYTKALELKPDEAAYHNNFAIALVSGKKIPEAQAELTKAAQLDPKEAGKYYYNLGAVLTNAGQADAAVDAFKKSIEVDPNYAEAYYQVGVALMSKAQISADGKVTPAAGTQEALEKYLQLKPDGPNAESAKGLLASITGSVDTAYKNPNAPAAKKGARKK